MNILITAGPTREPIDAVRYIGNRSSGKLGISLADAAHQANHNVTLLMGPGVEMPEMSEAIHVVRFESTADLQSLLAEYFPDCDILVMAAAVADYTPVNTHAGKLPRSQNQSETMVIELTPTPDLTASLAPRKKPNQTIIAFALEEADVLIERAAAKMKRKQVDAIVANPLGTMESERITPTLISMTGETYNPGELTKAQFAAWLIQQLQNF